MATEKQHENAYSDDEDIYPYEVEAEQEVLGCILVSPEDLPPKVAELEARDFYKEVHRDIFNAIRKLLDEGEPPHVPTLRNALKKSAELEANGGTEYLLALIEEAVPAAFNKTVANLQEWKRARLAIQQLGRDRDRLKDNPGSVDDLLPEIQNRLHSIEASPAENKPLPQPQTHPTFSNTIDEAVPPDGWLRKYMIYTDKLSEAPPAYNLAAGLAALATAARRMAYLPWGDGRLYPNIYAAIIGTQGRMRKSTAVNMATNLLVDCWPAGENENGEHQLGAVVPYDGSVEGIMNALRQSPAGIMTPRELSHLLAITRRSYNEGLSQFLADLFDAPPQITRVLAGKTLTVDRPALNILGASTLSWLTEQTEDQMLQGGLLSRFMYFFAFERGDLKPIRPQADKQRANDLKQGLIEIHRCLKRDDGRALTWTPEAEAAYREFYHHIETSELKSGDPVTGFCSRLSLHAIKVAMLYQLSLNPDSTHITLEAWRLAENLAAYLREGAMRFVDQAAGDKFSKERRKVLEIIQAEPGISRSDLLGKSRLSADRLDTHLKTLIEAGMVEEREGESTGGRRPKIYVALT